MSLEAIGTDYIIFFILGVLGVIFGISAIIYQFISYGYLIHSSSDPYEILGPWAAIGIVSLGAGAMAVHYSYKIFIPLRNISASTLARDCPYCGAMLEENALICQKCKQQTD